MKKLKQLFFLLSVVFIFSCNENSEYKVAFTGTYNPEVGIGKFQEVPLNGTIDSGLIEEGLRIYHTKCEACHKMNDELLVGPGLKGTTQRHSPEWIMNYLTNTDQMVEHDPYLQELIAKGSPRMPDQNLNGEEARALLELLRENDAK